VSRGSSFGLINVLAFVVMLISLLIAGGAYLYRDTLSQRVDEMKSSLERAQNIFEPEFLQELQIFDRRIQAAEQILGNHIAVSPIFEVLQDITLPTVRYIDFTYEIDTVNPNIVHVTMSGEAVSYDAVTLQADLFSKNRFIRNPIFSNFSLARTGNVEFDLMFDVSRSLVNFEQKIERSSLNQQQ
jgi:ABC-type uncharacterized transport system permease subunit